MGVRADADADGKAAAASETQARAAAPDFGPDNPPVRCPVSVILPAYNNRELLVRNLPALTAVVRERGVGDEVLVVDDGGQDDTQAFLQREYPDIRYLRKAANEGFGPTCNAGIAAARHAYILLLNTDVQVSPGFLEPLLAHFARPDVFGVSPHILRPDDPPVCQSVTSFRYRAGYFLLFWEPFPTMPTALPVLFCSGACALFDARKLRQVGGVDPLYRPYYEEDVDLGYAAWKRGWSCWYEPGAQVLHEESATVNKTVTHRRKALIGARNKHLFLWKNLHDGRYLAWHLACLLPRGLYWALRRRDTLYVAGFFAALPRLKEVWPARRRERAACVRTDRELNRLFAPLTLEIEQRMWQRRKNQN
jgi:GT2 family glycosyltransferase